MKKIRLGRGVNQYKRTYNKEIGVLLGLIICLLVMSHGVADYGDEKYVAEVKQEVKKTPTQKESIEDKIRKHFPRSHATIIPIAYAESGMNNNAVNYNCYYNKDESVVYKTKVKGSHSTFCKKEHRKYSYSVDCFILQRNYKGQKCPNISVDEHLEDVAKLSKVQGLNAWVAYQNKSYLAYTK